jgi:hypothetical protein
MAERATLIDSQLSMPLPLFSAFAQEVSYIKLSPPSPLLCQQLLLVLWQLDGVRRLRKLDELHRVAAHLQQHMRRTRVSTTGVLIVCCHTCTLSGAARLWTLAARLAAHLLC